MDHKNKETLVASVPFWFHSIDFGDGLISDGINTLDNQKIISSFIPVNLHGKTVLDVGAWDGFYSFECEKRGARVTAIDNDQHLQGHKGFDVAKAILGSKVEHYDMDLFDVPEKLKREFDIVLFMGVLYHLKDPLRALETLFKVTRDLLVLESHYIEFGDEIPLMRFYPGTELNNDPTNWWGPNIPALISMLKVAGFRAVEVVNRTLSGVSYDRVILRAYKQESRVAAKGPELGKQMNDDPKEYTISGMLEARDRMFICEVYRSLLKRAPDPVGMDYYLNGLRSGRMSPAEVIRHIRNSDEGEKKNVRLVNL